MTEEPRIIIPSEAPGRKTSGSGDLRFFLQKEDGLTCGTFTMQPGDRLSKNVMAHPGDELYYVLKGPSYCDLPDYDDKRVEIQEGQAFLIPAGTKHIPNNIPGKHEAIVFYVCTKWP